jgi:hypothetical protein
LPIARRKILAEAVAGKVASDLLHLLLIGDDAECFLENRLKLGMQIFDALFAELTRAIDGDVRHRPRPIQRDERDEVLEPVGAHIHQRLAHARAFHLEHADYFAAPQHFIGLGVVERDLRQLDADAALCQ